MKSMTILHDLLRDHAFVSLYNQVINAIRMIADIDHTNIAMANKSTGQVSDLYFKDLFCFDLKNAR